MINKFKLSIATALLSLLTACGGGGGGVSGPVASTASFPLDKVMANILTTPSTSNVTVSGNLSINGAKATAVNGSGPQTFSSLSAGTFEGMPAQKQTTTFIVNLVGKDVSLPLNEKTYSWVDSNGKPLGESSENPDDDYTVVTSVSPLPTAAKINDTGILWTANRYADSKKANLYGTMTATYVLEADTSSTALLTLIKEKKDTKNVTMSKDTLQLRITPTGTFTRVKIGFVEFATSSSLNGIYQ